ncbi:MAG: hypothetical protein LIP04_05120 [Tannerellaceae bacterium]|nr:hypothetical protein [Tannerellaceae bacterium]MCD7711349.1 hypothetical protein [Bacillota bacterium]
MRKRWRRSAGGELLNSEKYDLKWVETPAGTAFDKEARKDSLFHNLNLLRIDPEGMLLCQRSPDSLLIVKSALILNPQDIIVREYFHIPYSAPQESISISNSPIWEGKVYDGEWIGTFNLGPHKAFSAEDTLEEIFWPGERNKAKNRRDANAWKYYNLEDMEE